MSNYDTTTDLTAVHTKGNKKETDRKSILEMCGKFEVTFDFAETFSPNKEYKREDLYKNQGIEYIFAIKDEPEFISLQHILVINNRFVVKHWRQDWIFENRDFLVFNKEGVWKKKTISEDQAKGTWTQKVFQVDDSPRYQGYGTWIYADGKKYWESIADAPLPRRQEHRTDYNVLVRNSRINLTDYGWMMDQNNQKVSRNEKGEDNLIVWEKGFEILKRGDHNIQPAIDYWENHKNFWEDAREIWEDLVKENDEIRIHEMIGEKHLYDYFFEYAAKFGAENYDRQIVREAISSIIKKHQF